MKTNGRRSVRFYPLAVPQPRKSREGPRQNFVLRTQILDRPGVAFNAASADQDTLKRLDVTSRRCDIEPFERVLIGGGGVKRDALAGRDILRPQDEILSGTLTAFPWLGDRKWVEPNRSPPIGLHRQSIGSA